jgi:hypothetical protein
MARPAVLKYQLAELEEAVCRDTQQKCGDEGCDICGRPNAMDELTHDTDSRFTPPSLKLPVFATTRMLVAAFAAKVLLSGAGLGAILPTKIEGESSNDHPHRRRRGQPLACAQ